MTVKDLMDDVALLGAERYIESIDETAKPNFFRSATKAYAQINAIRPKKGTIYIHRDVEEYREGGETKYRYVWVAEYKTNAQVREYENVGKGTVSLNFGGWNDFMRFLSPPYTLWGAFMNEGTEYYINDKTLEIKTDVEKLYIDFYIKPQTFSANDVPEEGESTVIALDEDLLPLLANLTGYYVLMEDNPAIAANLKNEYEEQYALIIRDKKSRQAGYFTNGW